MISTDGSFLTFGRLSGGMSCSGRFFEGGVLDFGNVMSPDRALPSVRTSFDESTSPAKTSFDE